MKKELGRTKAQVKEGEASGYCAVQTSQTADSPGLRTAGLAGAGVGTFSSLVIMRRNLACNATSVDQRGPAFPRGGCIADPAWQR
ncbi:UNVERIFIED_CONTAM: hypothetical protein FKN15_016331 [Acipenser sinensis]